MKQKFLPLALAAAFVCTAGGCASHSTTDGADLPSSLPQSTVSAPASTGSSLVSEPADSAASAVSAASSDSAASASPAPASLPAEGDAQPASSHSDTVVSDTEAPAACPQRVYLDGLMRENQVFLDEILYLSENERVALVPLQREYPVGAAAVQAEFINCSDQAFYYGPDSRDFSLEKLVGEVWVQVPTAVSPILVPEIAASVEPHGRQVKDFDLRIYRSDWLTAGRYRILEGQPGNAYAPRFKCYFRLYDDGNPPPAENLDAIFQDAAARGDTVYSLPGGGQAALVPEQRSAASADGYLGFRYVNNADTSFTFDWNGSYVRLQRLTDGQWVTVSETVPQPDNPLPTTVAPHSGYQRFLYTYDLDMQPGEYRLWEGPAAEGDPRFVCHFTITG